MTTTTERLRTFWGERQFESDTLSGLVTRYWEIALYGAIMSIALAMRFWHLDDRAIHHDESLHMYYAWQIFKGQGYEHVPFMHGPLKFFGTALMFRLFGDNDFTARLLFALVGTALVGLPYFLRNYIGRIGAIVAAALLAFSPSLVYVSRFNRDDILIVAYTLAMVVVMWRYLKEQQENHGHLPGLPGVPARIRPVRSVPRVEDVDTRRDGRRVRDLPCDRLALGRLMAALRSAS
jgi:predicted membrane-bound mannosyltransferase